MIGELINTIIKADTVGHLATVTPKSVKPMVDYLNTKTKQTLPAIYYTVRLVPEQNKNGNGNFKFQFTLITFCNRYTEAWELANALNQTFIDYRRHTVAGFKVIEIECLSITDDYEFQYESYGHRLEFSIQTQNLNS